jgi:MFS family permease
MCVTLAFSIIVTFCLWLPIGTFTSAQISNSSSGPLALLYIFVLLFGFGSGSVISLAPVCFGQLCKASEYGQYYGTGYSLVSFATLICIPIGGALLPAIGTQGLAGFFGAVLVLSCVCFVFARWACLEYAWKWRVNI